MRWPDRIGRWKINGLLGMGGAAEVLLGSTGEEHESREAAIKRIAPGLVHDPETGAPHAESLRAEARLLSLVRHPNVVGFVELIDEEPGAIALEVLRGRTLAEVLTLGPLALDLTLEVGVQAARALHAVHDATDEQGAALEAAHRDVSPDNLFVTTEGAIKLFDFNVASFRGGPAQSGTLKGRIAYMAPEQARGESAQGSADVFSLGVVLWELIAGERLLWRGNTLATMRALLDEPIAAVSTRAIVPDALDALLAEMLARDPARRPSARAAEERLRGLAPEDPSRAARFAAHAS